MREYVAGIIDSIGGVVIAIGGTYDHIHILSYIPKTSSISEYVRNIKSNSSKWFNQKGFGVMHWQEGYAAFGVSPSNIDSVAQYVRMQEEHHRKLSFREEIAKYIKDKDVLETWDKWVFGDE
jgi:REP element-mobilizing transposase RayT